MRFYIKEWADKSASIITAHGQRLFTFSSVESALIACARSYNITDAQVIYAR